MRIEKKLEWPHLIVRQIDQLLIKPPACVFQGSVRADEVERRRDVEQRGMKEEGEELM